jgi:two-component system phosphate regulon response regulator PhoB
MKSRVLVIEDEPDVAEAIAWQLGRAGLDVVVAATGEQGLERSGRGTDLVLLDLNLPGMDGLEVCRMIRRQTATARVPIIIVSARGEEVDRVLGLEMGADDYVVKPFSAKELLARCRAALRRSAAAEGPAEGYHDESFDIDYGACSVRYRGQEVRLTQRELTLLRSLVESRGRVLTRERLLQAVWDDAEVDARAVDAAMRRLRAKLGTGRQHIETLVGFGYRFVVRPRTASDPSSG